MKPMFDETKLMTIPLNDGYKYVSRDGAGCAWGAAYMASHEIKGQFSCWRLSWAALFWRLWIMNTNEPLSDILNELEQDLYIGVPVSRVKECMLRGFKNMGCLKTNNPTNFSNKPDQIACER